MKKLLATILLILFLLCSSIEVAEAIVRVRGYYRRSTGTWVHPHYRSSPNRYKWDNWSSWGNYNPFTGRRGYIKWWSW